MGAIHWLEQYQPTQKFLYQIGLPTMIIQVSIRMALVI
jgi:hypothetical protein